MIERLAVEIFLGLVGVCGLIPVGLRMIKNTRKECEDILTEDKRQAVGAQVYIPPTALPNANEEKRLQ